MAVTIPDGLIADGAWHVVGNQPDFEARPGEIEDCGYNRSIGDGCHNCRTCREFLFWARGPMMYRVMLGEDGSPVSMETRQHQ